MKTFDTQFAVDIFDFYAKKLGISKFTVFNRLSTINREFGLNCMINGEEFYAQRDSFDCISPLTFISSYKFCLNGLTSGFTLKSLPEIFKATIINECISKDYGIFFRHIATDDIPDLNKQPTFMFIPRVRSLEELAIKMELEA